MELATGHRPAGDVPSSETGRRQFATRLTVVALLLWAAVDVLRTTVAVGYYEERIVTVTHDNVGMLPAWLAYRLFETLLPQRAASTYTNVAWILATLLVLSAFVTWLHQARRHARRLGGALEWSPGWTVGGWLVPVANLVIPYLVVRDVRRVSEPTPRLVSTGSWWAGVLATVVLNNLIWLHGAATSRDGWSHGTLLDTRGVAYPLWTAGSVATVLAVILTMRLVRRIDQAQQWATTRRSAG